MFGIPIIQIRDSLHSIKILNSKQQLPKLIPTAAMQNLPRIKKAQWVGLEIL